MVRTLDFHSNNVGSIPASLNMNKFFVKNKYLFAQKKLNNKFFKNYIRYSMDFRTLFPLNSPGSSDLKPSFLKNSYQNRILIKQSYLIIMWLGFLTKNTHKFSSKPTLFIKPYRQSRFTILKAPMAHKTFSQEQYLTRVYSLISTTKLPIKTPCVPDFNESMYTVLLLKSSFFFIETNLIFLNKLSITLGSGDSHLMKLF